MAGAIAMVKLEALSSAVSALGTVAQAVCQAKVSFWDPLTQASLAESVSALKKELDKLNYMKTDFENDVAFGSYMDWSRRVLRIDTEVSNLLAQYEYTKDSSTSSRSNFKEGLKKLLKEVTDLLQEGNQIRDVISQSPEPYSKRVRDITKFKTLRGPLEKILGWLNNDTVKGIRIHGTVGIGKTTIMLNLISHEKIVQMFDMVIWLTVSKEGSKENLSREHLQLAVLQTLRLKVGDIANPVEVAERISIALKGKKCLLLLDDVKKDVKLQDIGIPGFNYGSKVVLTTRFRHVCSSLVDKAIKVTSLDTNEAWMMFQDVLANQELIEDPKIERLAWRVCKECYGVPLYIEKVASTFKLKNNEYFWSRGLNSWRMWPEKECQGIREVYKSLKFCYDDLDDDQKKNCFLYGVLYPEGSDIKTDHLLECWEAEDFLGNMKEAHVSGHLVLNHLINVSLLEECKIKNHVMMHRFIRQMALYVVEKDPQCMYLIRTSSGLCKPPALEPWNEMRRISFGDNDLDQLPESPCSSTLSTLFMNQNLSLSSIPASFFDHMRNLHVLDLSYTGISSLPSSISMLITLKNLYLNSCRYLKDLPSDIAKLEKLETLDIRRSGFINIPIQIEGLIRLRHLRVSFTKSTNGNAISEADLSFGVLSKLCRLEELVVDVESPEQWSSEAGESIIKEVSSLEKLRILKFCIGQTVVDIIEVISELRLHVSESEATILQGFIEKHLWREDHSLTPFRVLIGCQNAEEPCLPDKLDTDRYIKYCHGGGSNFPVAKILGLADTFELLNHEDIKQLSDFGTMKRVKYCLVQNCDVLETIVGSAADIVLPNLEDLYLKNLPKLVSISAGPLEQKSLVHLQTLVLISCLDLKHVFPLGTIERFSELQHLEIEHCSEIVDVISEPEAVHNPYLLPKLKKLILRKMPALSFICKVDYLEWPSLEELEIQICPDLWTLPFNGNNAKKLKVINAEQHWWDEMKLGNQVKDRLQKVFVTSGNL